MKNEDDNEKFEEAGTKQDRLSAGALNALTWVRDALGFGRLYLSLFVYLAISTPTYLIHFHYNDGEYFSFWSLTLQAISLTLGLYLRFKYPVSREYFLRIGRSPRS